ncbi:Putative Dedicator of cytokinesis protein 1 [[Torrubiella] hemipterigena]|uniref:Putative Dedicator of cytokinesis protein 1 n=1 Tax=[Torrubiella] hemipterigena TaxID=1531966 RepID=A0A0A1SPN3_9HYPO|nr:Putative Dedicator of cytokinesis protein 1 [[Torrubiella] hemipterigena]
MPWQPLPRIAFAVATYPFRAQDPADLPLEIGDELYIIEETSDAKWLRGYLVAPPSLLAGLTSVQGQTLEARVFSGIFPRSCVEVRELLGEQDDLEAEVASSEALSNGNIDAHKPSNRNGHTDQANGTFGTLSIPVKRNPNAPRPAAPVPMLKIGDETPTSASEPLVDEISSCLREWHSKNLHQLLLSRQYAKLDKLSALIARLNYHRQQFLYNVLTQHEYNLLREKTVWDLVQVNKLCGGEVIVRDPSARGRILTADDSVVSITELQSVMSLLDEPPQPSVELTTLHHLLIDVKGFASSSSDETTLVAYLVRKPEHEKAVNLSECFNVTIPAGRPINSLDQDSQRKTLFTELSSQDIGDVSASVSDLYLVIKVLSNQQISVRPVSRVGTAGESFYTNQHTKSLPTGGKGSRRSFMWGSMTGRSTFSRGSPTTRMDVVSEHSDSRPRTDRTLESREGPTPPKTAASQSSSSLVHETQTGQRPVGIAVLKLNALMKYSEETELIANIWSPCAAGSSTDTSDSDWVPLIRELMSNPNNGFEKSRRGERLQVSLKVFEHQDADMLIKANPTVLAGVPKTPRIGFSGAPTSTRSDIYFTLDNAALSRQNLLSRFGGSATSLPPGISGNNLQVTMEVRRSSGEKFEKCILPSSNSEPLTTFKSAIVERGDLWNQTVRITLPPEEVPDAHIVLYVSDMPGANFAVAHMPLWDREAFVRDGKHTLLLYKADDNTGTAQAGPTGRGGYLSLPSEPRTRDERSSDVTGPLAIINTRTFLCSTRFSQDRIILGLLRWRELSSEDLNSVLRQLMFVPEIEIVQLLSDILDNLFAVLVEHAGKDEYEDLVFTALVRVLDIVHDRRFNLVPIVDRYAATRFNYPYATTCLIRALTRLLEHSTEPEAARKLRATLKIVQQILRFITHARDQQRAKEADLGIATPPHAFNKQLRSVFKALDEMMQNPAPVLVGSQTLAVQHFHTWLPELTKLLPTEEILHIAIDFMDSCSNVKGKLILYKLILIINYSQLEIFAHPDQRAALSANTVRWISPHWGHTLEVSDQWREQVRLCCSVLASQLEYLGPEIPDHVPRAVDSYLAMLNSPLKPRNKLSLLFPSVYPFPSKAVAEDLSMDEGLAELSAILSAMATSPSGMQLELAENDLTILLENLLRVQMSILQADAFPDGWLSVHIYHHKSTMRTLQYLSGILLDSFLPDPDDGENFNTELWKLFFASLLKLVGTPSLALETFPEQKRRAVWKIAGDVREDGAALLRRMWEAIGWETTPEERARYSLTKIGGYQVQYVPTLVAPIVELCLSVHEGLRGMAVEVLQTMIISEWSLSDDLAVIQTEVVDCLDTFFKTKPLTESVLQKLFLGELLERFEPLAETSDEPLYAATQELIGTLDEFLDLLVAVHSNDDNSGAFDIINRLRLMEFLRDMQKQEIFVRYVQQLATVQADSGNHCEAGLALRLHADLYEWDPNRQAPALRDPDFDAQNHFERKEKIYFNMIKHFEEGESWSNALTAYKELKHQYETNIFDFAKLARTERAIATIYEMISKSDKIVPKYFKVTYKGLGFPAAQRDKVFIFEGSHSERGSAFADRLQEQYPAAKIVTSEDIDEVEGQFLSISSISPHRDLSHQVLQRARVPQVIRDFLLSSHPQSFSVTTKRNTSGPVHDHCAVKMLLTAAEPFPTILRRSEVVDVQELRLDAHQTALERILRKTQEVSTLERRIADGQEQALPALADLIAASVEPDSETSIAAYRQLLPQPTRPGSGEDDDEDEEEEEEEETPDLEPRDLAIQTALFDHALAIKSSLALLLRSKTSSINARHDGLQRKFEISFAPEVSQFAPAPSPQPAMSTPSTAWKGSPSINQSPWTSIASPATLGRGEEAAIVRQVTVQQKGTRLSFLGGRKKSHDPSADFPLSPMSNNAVNGHRRSLSKDKSSPNRFWSPASETVTSPILNARRQSTPSRDSLDNRSSQDGRPSLDKEPSPLKRGGSMRKRLSLLKIGLKPSRSTNFMGSVDEERE